MGLKDSKLNSDTRFYKDTLNQYNGIKIIIMLMSHYRMIKCIV